jgi:hypothetical protein
MHLGGNMASSRKFFTISAACASTVFATRAPAQSGRRVLLTPGLHASVVTAGAPFPGESDEATARALDELALAAAEFGDPETQLRALFQATLFYEYLGDEPRVAERLPRIRELLTSPGISDETRRDIASRIPQATPRFHARRSGVRRAS